MFDFHISNLYKRCSNLVGWILKTFTIRDPQVMLTLYKSLVMSRLDYASQLYFLEPVYIYIYYRFIVRFPIGFDFLFITLTFLLHFLLSWTSSLSISSSAMSTFTLSNHVFLGLPASLLPSMLYSIHFFTQSSLHVHTISVYHF